MPLLQGDIRFARSVNMADVPEGGGPPSAQLLTSGRSNEICPDISEETRTVGRTEIYQIHGLLRNTDRAALLGSNVILAQPPADPNVSVTLLSLGNPFATRAEIAARIEAGSSPGPEWNGYLLENHYETMRSMAVLQRPGMSPPTIGRTYLLVYNEGLAGERRQRVRIKATDTTTRMFTEIVNGQLMDFEAQVTTCELFDGLLHDYPGSPPSRYFARAAGKTVLRETVYSDSGMFHGASRLTAPTVPTDVWLQLDSVYTQLVPNSRTEAATVDARPTARQTVVLADAPRRVEVGITPHTQRIKIGEENAGLVYTAQLRPLPEPGTVYIDYWSLGNRYTITDDGAGRLAGQGGGSVDALTGSLAMTLKALPDIGSSITITHGTRVGYTDRSGQGAQVRAPEFSFVIEGNSDSDQIVPNTLVITYPSAGQMRTVTDNGAGRLSGAGSGVVDYPSRSVLLRPSGMLDAGAQLQIDCSLDAVVTEIMPSGSVPAPDGAGYIQIPLAQQPAARSLRLLWAVVRSVSSTAGAALTTTRAGKSDTATYTTRSVPEYYEPEPTTGAGVTYPESSNDPAPDESGG
ncbi:MAG: hypothetical protein L6Q63_02335 [Giesbergeria sp.]|nr:hypothetical protein [Giesbergeria sp.]